MRRDVRTFKIDTNVSRRAPVAGVIGGALATVLLGLLGVHFVAPLFAALFTILSLVAFIVPLARLDMGDDGLVIRSLMKRAFIPASTVASVAGFEDSVLLRQDADGVRWKIRIYCKAPSELYRALEELVARNRLTTEPTGANALLPARGEGDMAAWRRDLEQATDGGNHLYRAASVTRDALFMIVESGERPVADRVAAAVALRATMTSSERDRLVAIATASALPELRDLLVRVGDEQATDEGIEEALERAARIPRA